MAGQTFNTTRTDGHKFNQAVVSVPAAVYDEVFNGAATTNQTISFASDVEGCALMELQVQATGATAPTDTLTFTFYSDRGETITFGTESVVMPSGVTTGTAGVTTVSFANFENIVRYKVTGTVTGTGSLSNLKIYVVKKNSGSSTIAVDSSGAATTLTVDSDGALEVTTKSEDDITLSTRVREINPQNEKYVVDVDLIDVTSSSTDVTANVTMNGYNACSIQAVVGGGSFALTVEGTIDGTNYIDVTNDVFGTTALTASGTLIDDAGALGHFADINIIATIDSATASVSTKRMVL